MKKAGWSRWAVLSALVVFCSPRGAAQNARPSAPVLLEPAYQANVSPTPKFVLVAIDYDNDRLQFKLEVLQRGVVILTFNQVQDKTGWDKTDYASDEVATFTLPSRNALADGAYTWRAFTFDTHQWSGSSRSQSFRVESVPGKVRVVAHLPGTMKDVFVQGDHAYVISNRGLLSYDVSNPATPTQQSCFGLPPGSTHIYVANSFAYVTAEGSALCVIDISNPARPLVKGVTDSALGGGDLDVCGSYAYVTASDFGLRVIDVSNPEAPREVGHYCPPETVVPPDSLEPFAIVDVHVSGSYAYIVNFVEDLRLIDISNPADPREVSRKYQWHWGPRSVYVSGKYAYVGADCGLYVVDVSNPMALTEAGHYDGRSSPWMSSGFVDVCVSQPYAYAANASGLVVIDVSEPTAPVTAGWFETPGGAEAQSVCVSGSYVYLAADWAGLFVLKFGETGPPVPPYQPGVPRPPTLVSPADGAIVSSTPTFQLAAIDPEHDRLKYKIELRQNDVVIQTADQTQDPTGWDKPAYASGEMATFVLPVSRALTGGAYQWRAYAFDGMQWSTASQIFCFGVVQIDKPAAPNSVKSLAKYENCIGEMGSSTENKDLQMWTPKRHEERARLIFDYLKDGHQVLCAMFGGHDVPFKFSVEHYPPDTKCPLPAKLGGTDAEGTICYNYTNLEADLLEWDGHSIPNMIGYYEEMAHSFARNLGLRDGLRDKEEISVGFYETLGMMIGGETALRTTWRNPFTQTEVAATYRRAAKTTDHYLAIPNDCNVSEEKCLTRILTHVFKTEIVDVYGWKALSDAFCAIRDGYPLRSYNPNHTWGGFLEYLGKEVQSDLHEIFGSYGLPVLKWTGEEGYKKDGVEPTGVKDRYRFRVRIVDKEGSLPTDVRVHLYEGTLEDGPPEEMSRVGDSAEGGWIYQAEVELGDPAGHTYAFSAHDGAHEIFQAVGKPTIKMPVSAGLEASQGVNSHRGRRGQ